jgi:putative FmdB family regulatory protein
MPMYDYHCCGCGAFSALRPLSEYRDPMQCPGCGGATSRVISAPSLAVMTSGNRTAWERNERSAHEPRRSSCSSGNCGHAHHKAKPDTAAAPLSINKQPSQSRPWMLGH